MGAHFPNGGRAASRAVSWNTYACATDVQLTPNESLVSGVKNYLDSTASLVPRPKDALVYTVLRLHVII